MTRPGKRYRRHCRRWAKLLLADWPRGSMRCRVEVWPGIKRPWVFLDADTHWWHPWKSGEW